MQISNPLVDPLFFSLVRTFAIMLSAALMGVLWGVFAGKDAELKKQLILRWLSWACIAAITVLAVLSGITVFAGLVTCISLACTLELCKMSKMAMPERIVLILAAVLLPLTAGFAECKVVPLLLSLSVALAVLSLRNVSNLRSLGVSLLTLLYVPFLASHAVLLYGLVRPSLVISIVSASALANVFAFVFGKLFGGPKLAPKISPNKTWSGVVGSVVGAYIGFSLLSLATHLTPPLALSLVLPLVVALVGVCGDLFESMLKRSFKVKDAGSWLPGFGGALDRVDGLLFILPCVYYRVSSII